MKNQTARRVFRFLPPEILALVVAVFWAVSPATAAEAQMTRVSKIEVAISGGSGKEAWRLRYGVSTWGGFEPRFALGEGNRAWYSRGGWLRLIDTQKGVVLGRWRYPGEIINLTPEGAKVQVEIADRASEKRTFHRKFQLDPGDPHVPYWPPNLLSLYRISDYERELWPSAISFFRPGKIPAEEAKRILPELEEAVRRDPFTPWFRVGLGKVQRDLGDLRATVELPEAINSSGTDFTELFQISRYLDGIGEKDLARAAFDRACQDFWQKGNDPRMLTALIDRLILYQPYGNDYGDPSTPNGMELIERVFELAPYGEGTPIAWRVYAGFLSAHGSTDRARLWRTRADNAAQNEAPIREFMRIADRWLLLVFGALWATIIYPFVLFVRYRPQRRLEMAARERAGMKARGFAFFNTKYWSRRERIVFFIIVFLGWFSVGIAGQYVAAVVRQATSPIGAMAGNYGGPVTIASFEQDLPATPERDLLLATAYQQDSQLDKAEALYRKIPQFAESWNNLGVILKAQGKNDETKAAFEKALALDPMLAEASFNLGNPPSDFWTQQHQKYMPSQPMLAPPSGSHVERAFMGASPATVFLRGLAGPLSKNSLFNYFSLVRNPRSLANKQMASATGGGAI